MKVRMMNPKVCKVSKLEMRLPKATAQQSLLASDSFGCIIATGSFSCLTSHTLTVPKIYIVLRRGSNWLAS